MILFALKYWKYIAIVLAVLSLVGALFIYRASLINKGVEEGLYQCELQKKEAINANIKIRENQDGVVRPSNITLINSLRGGTF